MTILPYVLHTEAQKERIAGVNAAGLGFGVMIPMHTVYHRKGGKMVPSHNVPLFPRYIIVEFDIEADRARYPALNRMRGAAAVKPGSKMALLCGSGDVPVAVPPAAMKIITDRERARHDAEDGIKIENPFKVGDAIVAEAGPFASFAGQIQSVSGVDRVKALLDIFCRKTLVEFDVGDLRSAS